MTRLTAHTNGASRLVALSEGDWQRIIQLLSGATIIEDIQAGEPDTLLERARHAFADRRRRSAIFGVGIFGEPAWDILLVLYIERQMHRHSMGSLAKLAGLAPSTTQRWIDALEARHLVRRTIHPTDKRAAFVQLTEKGEAALDSYFSETLTAMR